MKIVQYLSVFCLLALSVGCKHDDEAEHHFDNKLYITSESVTSDLLIKNGVTTETRSIAMRLAMPAEQNIAVTFAARPELTALYNLIYKDNAEALPAEYYALPETPAIIRAGEITGEEVPVEFVGIDRLDDQRRYVLPVSIASADGIDVLESRRTVYFLIKGAALINVVANISEMYFRVEFSGEAYDDMSFAPVVTVEALLRSNDWTGGRTNNDVISTVFGMENHFLIRIGDADRPANQLQVVCPDGSKWPAANTVDGLPTGEWVHIAIVYDTTTGERIYYRDGRVVASDMGAVRPLDITDNCNIGISYNGDRWLPGEISELRVWKCQRTAEQIASNPYRVSPDSENLVAYWKFNEGSGRTVYDVTGHGADLSGSREPKWVSVVLPPIE